MDWQGGPGISCCKRVVSSTDSSGRSSRRQGERVLPGRHQQAIGASHLLPVIFVGGSTNQTDLIMLAIAAESWPGKPMGAQVSEESLKEFHVRYSLCAARLDGAICFEEWRVNRLDYDPDTLSNYGSACQAEVTANLHD
jgi:hypothetical protein